MRAYLLPLLLVGGVVAIPLAAQLPTTVPGAADPARVTGGNYVVEPTHTQVLFAYDHMGFSMNMGVIGMPTGTLVLDPEKPADAKVSITIPIANIRTGIPAMDDSLMSDKFFEVAKYPTATFVSTDVKVDGTSAAITGNLTIRDKTVPVTLQATFYGAGISPIGTKKEQLGFSATALVKRSAFGMERGVPIVGDDIKLSIVAAFEKE